MKITHPSSAPAQPGEYINAPRGRAAHVTEGVHAA